MSSVHLRVLCGSVLCAAGCAAQSVASPDAFTFAIIGDAPYKAKEEAPFARMLARIDREDVAFTIHVGDIGAGKAACTDEFYARTRRQLDAHRHPLIYTPGDNEWTDCRESGFDPLERLAKIRTVFFATSKSLGVEPLELEVQQDRAPGCGAYPENRSWVSHGVRFVTIDVPGSENNRGRDAAGDAEAHCRDDANRRWIDRAVAASLGADTRAFVIATQANPWRTTGHVYRPTLSAIEDAARRLHKPVLFVHGDTHNYQADTPFVDALGAPLPGITRVETYGSPIVGWVKVTVDPSGPRTWTFAPHIEAIVP